MGSRFLTENVDKLLHEDNGGFILLEDDDGTPVYGGGRDSNDAADPLFYDWWRNQARRKIKEKVEEAAAEQEFEPSQPIREAFIEMVATASSLDEMRELDLLDHERAALEQLIRDYLQYLKDDEEEAQFLLLLH